jgi:hypothetical protein
MGFERGRVAGQSVFELHYLQVLSIWRISTDTTSVLTPPRILRTVITIRSMHVYRLDLNVSNDEL